jgi:hypothetical protein
MVSFEISLPICSNTVFAAFLSLPAGSTSSRLPSQAKLRHPIRTGLIHTKSSPRFITRARRANQPRPIGPSLRIAGFPCDGLWLAEISRFFNSVLAHHFSAGHGLETTRRDGEKMELAYPESRTIHDSFRTADAILFMGSVHRECIDHGVRSLHSGCIPVVNFPPRPSSD